MVQRQDKKKKLELKIAPETTAVVLTILNEALEKDKEYSPKTLFKHLQRINSRYALNTNLVYSFEQIEFVGFLRPYTLLVHGNKVHIDYLHHAWINNQLSSPPGFKLDYIGELASLHIKLISKMSGNPLPDTLRHLISQLNLSGVDANVKSIKGQLLSHYQRLHKKPPPDQLVFETLNTLLTENQVVLEKSGYYVVQQQQQHRIKQPSTPAESRLQLENPPLTHQQMMRRKKYIRQIQRGFAHNQPPRSHVQQPAMYKKQKRFTLTTDENMNNQWIATNKKEAYSKHRHIEKSAAFKKLFKLKSAKTALKSDGGSSNKMSSSNSSSLSDDEESGGLDQTVVCRQQIGCDSISQLTDRPPFQSTSVSDSMTVHYGETVLQGTPDVTLCSDYKPEREDEDIIENTPKIYQRLPTLRRARASTQLRTRPIVNSPDTTCSQSPQSPSFISAYAHILSETSDSFQSDYSTELYSDSPGFINSTQISPSACKLTDFVNVPDLSSIVEDNSTTLIKPVIDQTCVQSIPANKPPGKRPTVDGKSNVVTHHSTPNVAPNTPCRGERVFNATGQSHCIIPLSDCHYEDSESYPSTSHSRGIPHDLVSRCSTEMFCDCDNASKCGCTRLIEYSVQQSLVIN